MTANRFRFRAWDKRCNSMTDSDCDNLVGFDGSIWYNSGSFEDALFEQHDYILMQSTGLTDKNGQEIFEGDIVSFRYGRYIVEFFDGCFVIAPNDNPQCGCLRSEEYDRGEIIGNIYENAELLEA